MNGNLRPWYGAGAGTTATEILAQGPAPNQVVVPMASGAPAYQCAQASVLVLTGGPPRWPEDPVAVAGAAVTIEPSLAALRDAVEEETS